MQVHFALMIVAGMTLFVALLVYYFGLRSSEAREREAAAASPSTHQQSPLSLLFTNMGSRGTPMDIAAKGLFLSQLRRSPIATVAATVAIGALVAMVTGDDDEA